MILISLLLLQDQSCNELESLFKTIPILIFEVLNNEMKIKILILLWAIFFLQGCSSSHIIVAWKNQYQPENYSKIMVVGIVTGKDHSLRKEIETELANELKEIGYYAVPAIDEFGEAGLANLSQEETYRKLCSNSIDAVITITLIDISKEKIAGPKRSYGYPHNYYYNRIWNYRNIQADLSAEDKNQKPQYAWESILFNLRTLQAECTIQTKIFSTLNEEKLGREFEKQIIMNLVKQKVLIKKAPYFVPKAF